MWFCSATVQCWGNLITAEYLKCCRFIPHLLQYCSFTVPQNSLRPFWVLRSRIFQSILYLSAFNAFHHGNPSFSLILPRVIFETLYRLINLFTCQLLSLSNVVLIHEHCGGGQMLSWCHYHSHSAEVQFYFASPSSIFGNAAGALLGVGRRSLCNFCVVDSH